ncbi:MAG: hypothetical protein A2W00_08150 [Candidatus Eisenbacteria bacterium RBG_16_71_46]|nr:MAG: hypothetical protein A2W00_08150 [Candidatus Eisenbacteria bacterium RBG_16_71_46]
MHHFAPARRPAAAGLRAAGVAAALALAVSGCTKQPTRVDPAYTSPEGSPAAAARLILFPDTPILLRTYQDAPPPGPSSADVFLGSSEVRLAGPGIVHGLIIDGTAAESYRVMRRESGGGLRAVKDYLLQPARRWLDSHYEAYAFNDTLNSGFSPPTYVGQGVVAGAITASAPLTNEAQMGSDPIANITYTGTRFPANAQGRCDSLFTMQWTAVPGAAGYWIQAFQFRQAGIDEVIRASAPGPMYLNLSRDLFVGYVAAPATTYKLGGPGALVLTQRTPMCGRPYRVRISAVDALGRLLAFTYGDSSFAQGATTYRLYASGSVVVQPQDR